LVNHGILGRGSPCGRHARAARVSHDWLGSLSGSG
jgi:hypothetical protein